MGRQRKSKVWPRCNGVVIRGRLFTQHVLVMLRGLIRSHPHWGRTKLSISACEILNWMQANGRTKDRACRVAFLRLEKQGFLQLPKRILDRGGQPPTIEALGGETVKLRTVAIMPPVVECRLVRSRADSRLWNTLIASHHYLGLVTPVGRVLRYLVFGDNMLLGAILFHGLCVEHHPRDSVLLAMGYDRSTIREIVITNNRFLILPSVTVPN